MQNVDVYGVNETFSETSLTWNSALSNIANSNAVTGTHLASLNISGENIYSVDVTEYVKSLKESGKTEAVFAITPNAANNDKVIIGSKELNSVSVYAPDIDSLDETAFVYDKGGASYFNTDTPYAYTVGGAPSLTVKKVSSDVNYPDSETGKSIMFEKNSLSTAGLGRVKLLNSLTQREFTDADKGTEFTYSFKIRYAEGSLGEGVTESKTINVGQIGVSGTAKTTLRNSKALTVKSTEWTSYTYSFTLSDISYCMLGFTQNASDSVAFYVDDLVVTRELNADEVAPVLTNGENVIAACADTMIANGTDRDTSFGSAKTITVNYGTSEIINKYRITDEDIEGKVLAKESFKYSRTVKNNNDTAKDVMLIAAVYDSNANLVCVKNDSQTIGAHDSQKFTVNTGILPDTVNDSCTLKVMMWETDTLCPIFDSETYSNLYDSDEVVLTYFPQNVYLFGKRYQRRNSRCFQPVRLPQLRLAAAAPTAVCQAACQ